VKCTVGAEFATEASGDAVSSRCDRSGVQDVHGLSQEPSPFWPQCPGGAGSRALGDR